MKKIVLVLFFALTTTFSLKAQCPDGESQGREWDVWDPLNGQVIICPHEDGLSWCCYDPCDIE